MLVVKWLIITYIIGMNVYGTGSMKRDKQYAVKKARRIPEAKLWKTAFLGGACGAFMGMRMYRHKTKHATFRFGLPILSIIQIIIFLVLLVYIA